MYITDKKWVLFQLKNTCTVRFFYLQNGLKKKSQLAHQVDKRTKRKRTK